MGKKMVSVLLVLTVVVVFTVVLFPVGASAFTLEWTQTDWSGGPGQALWEDPTAYDTSLRVDTSSVPGSMRISNITGVAYTKEATNPVVPVGGAGSWDESMINGLPRQSAGGGYEIVYSGEDTAALWAVGYANSPDGINWSKSSANPVLQRTGTLTWDQSGVATGSIVSGGDGYQMFFNGFEGGGVRRVGLATSPDLQNWTRDADFVFGPGSAGSWEERINRHRVYKEGNTYKMWYLARDAGNIGRIGYATSADGVSWTKYAGNPVLDLGTAPSFDDTNINDFALLPRPWSGDYLMIYQGADSGGDYGLGVAVSADGVAWTKDPGNPIIQTGTGGSWYENNLNVISLGFDGGIYKMSVYGADSTIPYNLVSTGEFWSDDGLAWTPNFLNPLITPSAGPAWDDMTTMSASPFLEGGQLRTFYIGQSYGLPREVGTATSNPLYTGVPATLESSVFDAKTTAEWGNVTWDEIKPANTDVQVDVRCGDVQVPDGSWTAWANVANGDPVPHADSRYIQYKVTLSTTDDTVTPEVEEISIGVKPLTEWYLAEGSTGIDYRGNFETWVLVQNPGDNDATVNIFYQTPEGETAGPVLTLDPHSRTTVNVAETLPNEFSVSTRITSDNPVIAERAMYWNSAAGVYRQAAHDSIGVLGTSTEWYLAEGSTGTNEYGTFETWVLVQNPGGDTANVQLFFQTPTGETPGPELTLAPHTRQTVNVADTVANEFSVSTRVASDNPVIAERAMYWNSVSGVFRQAAHDSIGVVASETNWYLAEGSTGTNESGTFETWVLVQNAGVDPAEVDLFFQTPAGEVQGPHLTLAPNTRQTVNVAETVPNEFSVSTRVTSDNPVIAERAMYWNSTAGVYRQAAHDSIGSPIAGTSWYLAEGSTGINQSGAFETWILVQNPWDEAAEVDVFYQTPTGEVAGPHLILAPYTRQSVNIADTSAVSNEFSVSTRVSSSMPVIAERAMYWNAATGINRQAAHDSIGLDP